jgi:hypothetical protein
MLFLESVTIFLCIVFNWNLISNVIVKLRAYFFYFEIFVFEEITMSHL